MIDFVAFILSIRLQKRLTNPKTLIKVKIPSIVESMMSITVSTNWKMLKKQLIIVSSNEVHRLEFYMFSKETEVVSNEPPYMLK